MAKDATITRSSTGSESVADSTASILAKGEGNTYWPPIGRKDEIPGWLRDNDLSLMAIPCPPIRIGSHFDYGDVCTWRR